MQNNELFRQRLQHLREKKRGLNRKTLSELCGLPPGTIRKYERGEVENPTIESLELIADYFSVSIDFLIGRDEKQ